jgi:hypothetical protein
MAHSLQSTEISKYIQSVPGGKVNIMGGHSIGHYKQKKIYVYMCPILDGFRDTAISLYSSEIVDREEILRTVSSNDKVGIVYLPSSLSFYSPLDLGPFFSFLMYTQSVGLLGRGISQSQGRNLHTEQHRHRINTFRYPCLA